MLESCGKSAKWYIYKDGQATRRTATQQHSRDSEGVYDGPDGLHGRGEGGVAGGDEEDTGITEEAGQELQHVVDPWAVTGSERVKGYG